MDSNKRQKLEESAPNVQARFAGEPIVRATTWLRAATDVAFEDCVCGTATAALYESDNEGSRGGIVLRLTIDDEGGALIPHGVLLPNGVEVHLAGDAEALALIHALQKALVARAWERPANAIVSSYESVPPQAETARDRLPLPPFPGLSLKVDE